MMFPWIDIGRSHGLILDKAHPCQGLHLQRRHQRPQRFALAPGAAAAAHGARPASWHGGGAQRGALKVGIWAG